MDLFPDPDALAPSADAGVGAIDGIRVGIGGWTFAPWRGTFYPAGLVQRRELEHASRQLGSIEVNGTFYGAQKPATYAKWASEAPDGFVFSLKAPKRVTYGGPLARQLGPARAFIDGGLAEFGTKLGPLLWQLAPSRRFDAGDLAAFLDGLPRTLDGRPLRHVLEVRHASFLDPAYVALARAAGVATVFTDSDQHPALADVTGPIAYARLMQSSEAQASGYPPDALDAWARRARAWARGDAPADLPYVSEPVTAGPREVFIYFISAAKVRNPAAAMALTARLQVAGA